MNTAIAAIPHWYLRLYMREQVTPAFAMLAVIQWLVSFAFLPPLQLLTYLWQRLFRSVEHDSPRIYEMFLALVEAFLAAFFLMSLKSDQGRSLLMVLAKQAPIPVWAAVAGALALFHFVTVIRGAWEWRAYALTLSFVGWYMFSRSFVRWGFSFVEAIATPVWIICLVSIACLMWQHSRGHGGGGDRGRLE